MIFIVVSFLIGAMVGALIGYGWGHRRGWAAGCARVDGLIFRALYKTNELVKMKQSQEAALGEEKQ